MISDNLVRALAMTFVLMLTINPQALAEEEEELPDLPLDTNRGAGLVVADPIDITSDPYVRLPLRDAYYEETKVWYTHTEVSDSVMADRLSRMVNYRILHTPRLEQINPGVAGALYMFTNGVPRKSIAPWGGGPFNFQIDVIDSIPGDGDYTPLRQLHRVTWQDQASPRILRSEEAILSARDDGELTVRQTDIILNAPVIQPRIIDDAEASP